MLAEHESEGNDEELIHELLDAGVRAEDRAWHLPITEEYAEQLKSNFADFANIGGREGGAITAAAFLGKFTQGLKWAHLDVAGTAYQGGVHKGSTGKPTPLLSDFLIHRAARCRNQLQHIAAILVLGQRPLNRVNLSTNPPHSQRQLLFLPQCMRHMSLSFFEN